MRWLHFTVDNPAASVGDELARLDLTPPSPLLRRTILAVMRDTFFRSRIEIRVENQLRYTLDMGEDGSTPGEAVPASIIIEPGEIADMRVISNVTAGTLRPDISLDIAISDRLGAG